MKRKLFIQVLFMGLITLAISSCKKDEKTSTPTISLKNSVEYTSDGSYLLNHKAKIGIVADGCGANITNLTIKIKKSGITTTLLDQGFNDPQIDITKELQISQGDSLCWCITVMNKDRQTASISFNTRDTTLSYGEIWSFSGVRIGMQNSTLGSYYDPFSNHIYTSQDATANQSNVHILGYYYLSSGVPSYTFSSAGDSDAPTYLPTMSNWGVKNYTDWDYATIISMANFNACTNDSLLVAAFHAGAGVSSRKYKWADVGKIIPFKTSNNKTGLIKVNAIGGDDSGYIDFDIKIQK